MKDQVKDPLFNNSLEKKKLTVERTENIILGESVLIFSAEQKSKKSRNQIEKKSKQERKINNCLLINHQLHT